MNTRWISLTVICALLLTTIPVPAEDRSDGVGTIIDPRYSGGLFSSSYKEAVFDGDDVATLTFVSKPDAQVDERLEVSLNNIHFDPLAEEPSIPSDLSTSMATYLVQFKDRIYEHHKDRVTDLGGEFLQYIPYYAFAVRMDPSTANKVKELSFIRSVTPYYTYYKVAPELVGLKEGLVMVDFMAWKDHPTDGIAAHSRAIGAEPDWVDPLMVRSWVDRGQLVSLAANPDVWYAQVHTEWALTNNVDSDIIDARHYPDGAYNNPTDGIWSYSGGIGGAFDGIATGLGMIVADVDTGVDGTHNNFGDAVDFPEKKVWFKQYSTAGQWTDGNGHGTHTSGTAVGIGKHRGGNFDGLYTGMAPEAGLIGVRINGGSIYNWMNDPYSHGANITTNSWGGGAFGAYDEATAAYDLLVRDSDLGQAGDQQFITFFSAGNSGASGLTPPATGKNIIAVGATGGTSGTQNTVAGFSSRGPVADGRIKPDIMAPGTAITSSWRGSTDFTDAQGTSMSCPSAAGASALILDYYNTTYGFTPSPALTKALMINGATILNGYSYPGGTQGWGRINLANTLIETATKKILFQEEDDDLDLSTGTYVSFDLTVNSGAELRVHLVWTDEPGEPGANPALVNDLNLKMTAPDDSTYPGNKFTNGISTTGNIYDKLNNVEGVRLTNPATGAWTLDVIGFNIPDGPQDWALVISGDVSLSDPTYHFQDFSVDGLVLSDENPTEGDQISISATVRNSGNIPGAGLEYRILVDDKPIVKDTIAVLNAGQTTQVLGTWTALRGNHVAKVEVDYRGYLLEINEDNNTVVMGFGVNHFDMVTRVDPELQEVQPGMNATFKIEIENAGTLDDSFGIVITGPPVGFEFDLGADSADVDVLKKAIISLVVRTPSQAVAGTMATADITITSQGNTTHLSTVTATTRIKKLTGFEMTPIGDTEAYIDPRGNHEFDINVSNIGNAIDTVYIKNDITNPGWMVMTNATNMKLQPYEHQLLKLTVTPPYQPQGGDYVLVTLDGETTSGLTATLSFMVTVMDIHNISLSTVIEDSEVDPGGDLQAQIVMNNFGNNDESIEMYADVPDGWEALFDEDVPFILAYGAMEDFMTLEVPKDALAGDYNISIGAVGEYTEYEEVFTVTVGQKYGVEVDISPSRNSVKQKEKTSFTLKVTNSGNGEDTFDMHLIGAPSSMRISFDEDVIAVGPYDIGTVRISIEAMNTAPGTYSLTVEAVSQGNKAKSSSASFQVQVIEVSSTNNNNNNNNNNNTQIIDDPDDNDSSLFGTYGPYILVGLIALMVIILLTAVALRHRSKKAEELDSMPPPMEGDMGPPPGGAPTTYGQVDQMGPSAPLPGPGPRPPVDDGPLMERSIEEGPASETPRPSPPDQGMEGAMEPTPSEMPHEGHPPVQPPPPPPPPPPPIQDMGRPQEPAGPSTGTEGPDPSTSGQDQPVEKEKASGDDIDNMISNLMGKLD